MAQGRYENLNQLVSALLCSSIVSDGRPIYDSAVFVFNKDLGRLEYVKGLAPEFWSRLPMELTIYIAETLGTILFNRMPGPDSFDSLLLRRQCRAQLGNAALTCRLWGRKIRPLLFLNAVLLSITHALRELEKIISSPMSGQLKDHIHIIILEPTEHVVANGYLAAWRSLSRLLSSITNLKLDGDKHRAGLKSLNIRLRPCPRPLVHLTELKLCYVHFPSFSVLFRGIGALRSLQMLIMLGVQWKGACDPSSPPWSADTFRSIKTVDALRCTELWPFVWIFTISSLRYRHPRRAPDTEEDVPIRNARADVHAIVEATRALCGTRPGS